MNWISTKEKEPDPEAFIVVYRSYYPKFHWMGKKKDFRIHDETDEFDYWIELPCLPED